ncbi:A24 family peptidase [Paenibacillus sp. HB172176]|uniref:A24 family peptidase n=1 Tax=Paenibacillus sp. HB172176 TaxID=2493690 RepID=UPI00143C0C6B|nr:A24 family peptidase [Paenibacillus sp. HB172176]
MIISYLAVTALIAAAFATDIRKRMIPNRLTLLFFVSGVVYQLISFGTQGVTASFIGAASGFLPLLLLYAMKGIGAGDVKLFGAIGAWLGWLITLQLLMYSILFAGMIGVLLLIARVAWIRSAIRSLANRTPLVRSRAMALKEGQGKRNEFPFMLAVAPAAIALSLTLLP